jgi:hypothetical protein
VPAAEQSHASYYLLTTTDYSLLLLTTTTSYSLDTTNFLGGLRSRAHLSPPLYNI